MIKHEEISKRTQPTCVRIQRQVTFATRTRFFPFKWHSPGTILPRDIFRYIRHVSQNCIASFSRRKKKKRNADKVAISIDEATSVFYNVRRDRKFYNRNVSQLVVIRGVDVTSGGNLSWRRALPAFGVSPGAVRSCRRCALDVTFFLPLSSFTLHRLNIQLDPPLLREGNYPRNNLTCTLRS